MADLATQQAEERAVHAPEVKPGYMAACRVPMPSSAEPPRKQQTSGFPHSYVSGGWRVSAGIPYDARDAAASHAACGAAPAGAGNAAGGAAAGGAGGSTHADGTVPAGAPVPPQGAASYAPNPQVPQTPDAAPNVYTGYEPRPVSRGVHFAKWALAPVGVFFALLGIEFVATLIIVCALAPFFALSIGASSASVLEVLTDSSTFMMVDLLVELLALVAVVPWWLHVDKRGIGLLRAQNVRGPAARTVAWRVLALVLVAVGLQVVLSFVLGLVLPLFPEVMEAYEELMETAGMDTLAPLSFLAVVVAAPALEETVFRGIAFQFALRAVCPGWHKQLSSHDCGSMRITARQFWVANVLQALLFGIMHLNVVQGSYAFLSGLLLGWVFWRTGQLRWSIALHALFNFSSFGVDAVLGGLGLVATIIVVLVCAVLLVAGIALYEDATRGTAAEFAACEDSRA